MLKIKAAATLGTFALLAAFGVSGCAWGPLKTGAPHIDKALAAIHEAGYPTQEYEGKGKFNPNAGSPRGRGSNVNFSPY
jgi:hypothetical protein